MKKLFTIVIALFVFAGVKANDGAFYSKGNQLVPITETTIKVQKEILTITRDLSGQGLHRFKVNVYYEFFNPGPSKDLLVGFEAVTDAMGETHPYIRDFKVVMNDVELPFEVSRIFYPLNKNNQIDFEIKDYYKDGHFVEPTKAMWKAMEDKNSPYYYYEDVSAVPYYFVYHFNAHFNQGLNIIQHTYDFNASPGRETIEFIHAAILGNTDFKGLVDARLGRDYNTDTKGKKSLAFLVGTHLR